MTSWGGLAARASARSDLAAEAGGGARRVVGASMVSGGIDIDMADAH